MSRVRLVGTSATPTPPDGDDPLGLVEDWYDWLEPKLINNLITAPIDPSTGVYYHREYDGIWVCWYLSKLWADRDATLSAALFDWGQGCLEPLWNTSDMNHGPSEQQTQAVAWGYYNYSLGCYMYGKDPATVHPGGSNGLQMAVNYARFSQYSYSRFPLVSLAIGNNTWPSPTASDPIGNFDPTRPPTLCREIGRGLMAHMVCRDVYDTYCDLIGDGGYSYTLGSQLWTERIPAHMYFGSGVDLSGGAYGTEAYIDQWRTITAALAAANGDWTQVPDSWSGTQVVGGSHEYTPFMWTHFLLPLILYYEDNSYTGEPHDTTKALVTQAVTDMCDAAIAYFAAPAEDPAYTGLLYRISPDGEAPPEYPAKDLGFWQAFLFAWAYKQTGNVGYYNFAVELIRHNIRFGTLQWGKKINEPSYSAWWTFQLLGWTGTTFKLPWKFDLAGGETWPS